MGRGSFGYFFFLFSFLVFFSFLSLWKVIEIKRSVSVHCCVCVLSARTSFVMLSFSWLGSMSVVRFVFSFSLIAQ